MSLCLYLNRSRNSSHQQIFKIATTRRIEIPTPEQNNYFRSSLIFNEQQRTLPPELQVRRLSQEDWPYLTAYALPSILSTSLSSAASSSQRSNHYEL